MSNEVVLGYGFYAFMTLASAFYWDEKVRENKDMVPERYYTKTRFLVVVGYSVLWPITLTLRFVGALIVLSRKNKER